MIPGQYFIEEILKDTQKLFKEKFNNYLSDIDGYYNDGLILDKVQDDTSLCGFYIGMIEDIANTDPFVVIDIDVTESVSIGMATAFNFRLIIQLHKMPNMDGKMTDRILRYQKALVMIIENNHKIGRMTCMKITSLPTFFFSTEDGENKLSKPIISIIVDGKLA